MKSNVEWKYWGREDPLYGVASWQGKDVGGDNAWTDEEFYALGRDDWSCFMEHWDRYGRSSGTCIEIGCGAGRLTGAMAQYFEQVVALDVSEGMLEYARQNISATNVQFVLVAGSHVPRPDASIDATFSTHVFQHFESQDGAEAYFRELARVLRPGGSIMIHLPVHLWPFGAGSLVRATHRLLRNLHQFEVHVKRWLIRKGVKARLMEMRSYDVAWLYDTLKGVGFKDIEISVFETRSNSDRHPFVLARKA